ncbi:MAG: CPBP family intramembrane glutamic endopeptidase [Ekhidna sp.]
MSKRIFQFAGGFWVAALLCTIVQFVESWMESSNWILNDQATVLNVFDALWWDAKSVLTEELIYRGALLYLLINYLGSKKAILLSASAFGIYHWFSFGIFGNLIPMILVFLGTGLMGYAWALSYHKTKSIMMGFGLHLGWNVVLNTFFSKGPLGDQLLLKQGGSMMGDWASLLIFLMPLIVIPVVTLLFVNYAVTKEDASDELSLN